MAILEAFVSEIGVLLGIAIVIFLIWKVGKVILKIIFGVITNTILGFVVLFVANNVFTIGIPVTLPIMAAIALFGLPGVGTIIILHLAGTI
jgi:hypothetical protein